nr:PEP-CTERM sorting domain-containing protein [Massilia frigida]
MLRSTSFATGAGELAWRGVARLNWTVSKGSYWVMFSSTYANASQASMPGAVASPLDGYAQMQAGQWYDAAGLGLAQGLRVDATAAAVPEPGSMALFGLGLGLIAVWTRRRA